MEVPRSIYLTEAGEFCEFGDVQARVLVYPKGYPLSDEEASRKGLLDYLAQHSDPETPPPESPEVKMVEQAAVEDKAVSGPTDEKAPDAPEAELLGESGVSMPVETRRTGGGRRGA